MATNYHSWDGNLYESPAGAPPTANLTPGPGMGQAVNTTNPANIGDFLSDWKLVGKTMGPSLTFIGMGAGDSVTILSRNDLADSFDQSDAASKAALAALPGAPHPAMSSVTADTGPIPVGPVTFIRAYVHNASGNHITIGCHAQTPK